MGDQLGRKRVFLFGVLFFTVASILCGIATSSRALIVGRGLQGIGAAFLIPGSLAIISATFDEAERGRAIGTWSAFTAITRPSVRTPTCQVRASARAIRPATRSTSG